MGRIFKVQAKDIDTFRRKKRRKLRKGDVVRVGLPITPTKIRQELDLRPQTQDILATRKYGNTLVFAQDTYYSLEVGSRPGGFGHSALLGGEAFGFSKDAKDVFARMPNPLTDEDKICIANFVDAEVANGNWQYYDVFYHFGLTDPDNALTSWVGIINTSAPVGGAVHVIGAGIVFNGIDGYIDSGFNPSSFAAQYTLNNGHIAVNIVDADTSANLVAYAGANSGATNVVTSIEEEISGLLTIKSNGGVFNTAQMVADDQLIMGARYSSTDLDLYLDGTIVESAIVSALNLLNRNVYIGANNNDNTPNLFSDSLISSFQAGASVSFNHVQYDLNLDILNNCLLDGAIIDNFPNPLQPFEETAINKFLIAEAVAGNTKKYEEFYCFALTDEANALHGWGQIASASNLGAVHRPGLGFEFNGTTAYLNSGFNPAVDGNRYLQDDAQIELFVSKTTSVSGALTGASDANKIDIIVDSNNNFDLGLNSATSILDNTITASDNMLMAVVRGFAGGISSIKDTVQNALTLNSSGIPNLPIYVGARNFNGADDLHVDGVFSTFQIGAVAGVDQVAHYENLITLLNDLDVFGNGVVDSFPNALVASEAAAIKAFVKSQVANRNWFKKDSFSHFGLQDPVNALWDWKRKMGMTNNGTVHNAGIGRSFNGVDQYIDTNYNPSTDAVNFSQNDALTGGFVVSAVDQLQRLFSQGSTTRYQVEVTSLRLRLNSGTNIVDTNIELSKLEANTLTIATREDSSVSPYHVFKNSVNIGLTGNNTSAAISNANIIIGANETGTATFLDGTLSSFIAGAAIGFDHPSYYNDLVQLNTDLAGI